MFAVVLENILLFNYESKKLEVLIENNLIYKST